MSTADSINWATLKNIIEADVRTCESIKAKAEAGLDGLTKWSVDRCDAKLEMLASIQVSMATLESLSTPAVAS